LGWTWLSSKRHAEGGNQEAIDVSDDINGCMATKMCMAISGLPVKLSHEDTLVRVALAEADNLVDNALQVKAKHTCRHGGSDTMYVDGEADGACQGLDMGHTLILENASSGVNGALLDHIQGSNGAVWNLDPIVEGGTRPKPRWTSLSITCRNSSSHLIADLSLPCSIMYAFYMS
jgi:hypothetical protein